MESQTILNTLCQKLVNGEIRQSEFHLFYAESFLNVSLSTLKRTENPPIDFVELEDGYQMEVNKLGASTGQKNIMIPVDSYFYYKSDGSQYEILFPVEIKPRDYLTRLLEILKEGIQFFQDNIHLPIITPEAKNYNIQDNCALQLLKVLEVNLPKLYPDLHISFVAPHGETTYDIDNTLKIIKYLKEIRCSAAHQNTVTNVIEFTSTANVAQRSFQYTSDLFEILNQLLGNDLMSFAKKNIQNLSKLFESHQSWSKVRKSFRRSVLEGPVAGVTQEVVVDELKIERDRKNKARKRYDMLTKNMRFLINKFDVRSKPNPNSDSLIEILDKLGLTNTSNTLIDIISKTHISVSSKRSFYLSCFILYHYSTSTEKTSDQDFEDYLCQKEGCISDTDFRKSFENKV